MGGDGGSIPGRADIVKVRGYGFKRNLGGMGYDPNTLVFVGDGGLSKEEARRLQFQRCRLSQEILCPPIVSDRQGFLYNKETVLSLLIEKSLPDEVKQYVRKMKDLINLGNSTTDVPFASYDSKAQSLQCQLTGRICTGSGRWLLNAKCGCFFSLKSAQDLQLTTHSAQSTGIQTGGITDDTDLSREDLNALPTFKICPVCNTPEIDLIEIYSASPNSNLKRPHSTSSSKQSKKQKLTDKPLH